MRYTIINILLVLIIFKLYVRYTIDFGAVFSIVFVYLLLMKLPSWRVVILVSLLHYSLIHIPLIIYVMFLFQSEKNLNVLKSAKNNNG